MADQTNRGVSRVLVALLATQPTGALITLTPSLLTDIRRQIPGATEASLRSSLAWLVRRGILLSSNTRGIFINVSGSSGSSDAQANPEKVVIDNLLDAMAKAEPVLRKWRKVQEALDALRLPL
jgi:hypothetical protein